MPVAASAAKHSLIFVHRWMGVVFCLLFLLWFASGIGMMYWEYPLIMPADRLARAETIAADEIHLSPAEAYAKLGPDLPAPAETRLEMFNGRPVYKFGRGPDQTLVYADTGALQESFSPQLTRHIAASWTGLPDAAAIEEPSVRADQWTVFEGFQQLQPLRKYTWPSSEQVYVSALNGEVVQSTTRANRLGAYFGPIPHWLYFTPLRKNGARWTQLMIWSSGLATLAALIGISVGLCMYSPRKRFQYAGAPSAFPYAGWKRWHSILGLTFGVLACTWTFSGMLSMDPFPQWQGQRGGEIRERFAKALSDEVVRLHDFDAKSPSSALREAGADVKEADLMFVLGDAVYLMRRSGGATRIVPVSGEPRPQFSTSAILAALEHAAAPHLIAKTRTVARYESYYLDRRGLLPLPAIYAELDDPPHTTFYIDPATAQIVESYNSQSRRNRWLYHGLHSFNLPILYAHRPAWDVIILALMLGGVALSLTAVALGWQVLGRNLQRHTKRQKGPEKTVPAAP